MEKINLQEKYSIDKLRENSLHEKIGWKAKWTIEKFKGELKPGSVPYKVEVIDGNLGINAGIQVMEDLLISSGTPTVFSNANAHLGVGDDNTAAAAGQTDLQAVTNKVRKAMESTFPSRANQTISFKSVFGTGDANFAWEELGCFNASSAGAMLSRKVESKGTKTSADTWTLTLQLTVS